MVHDVCEVQMQLGYEQKKLIVTFPKEDRTGWLQGHQEHVTWLQCLGENGFHLKEMKEDEGRAHKEGNSAGERDSDW